MVVKLKLSPPAAYRPKGVFSETIKHSRCPGRIAGPHRSLYSFDAAVFFGKVRRTRSSRLRRNGLSGSSASWNGSRTALW